MRLLVVVRIPWVVVGKLLVVLLVVVGVRGGAVWGVGVRRGAVASWPSSSC